VAALAAGFAGILRGGFAEVCAGGLGGFGFFAMLNQRATPRAFILSAGSASGGARSQFANRGRRGGCGF